MCHYLGRREVKLKSESQEINLRLVCLGRDPYTEIQVENVIKMGIKLSIQCNHEHLLIREHYSVSTLYPIDRLVQTNNSAC